MICAEHISYSVDGKRILEDISFSASPGEIVTIIGPNGCGKSTFLKIMTRLLKADHGTVKFLGRKLSDYSGKELARQMAILPQTKKTPPDMTVEQLVQFGRYPYTGLGGQLKAEDFSAVDDALEKTGMERFRGRAVATLSGGEGQMAWIAMAMAQAPKILFLDEPTTYLDICYQLQVLELIRRLNREFSLTIVMVLHDINQAAAYSDRIFAIKDRSCYAFEKSNKIFTDAMFRDVFSVEAERYESKRRTIYMPERIVKTDEE